MNKNQFINFVVIILTSVFISCEKMDDTYKLFVGSGETIYIGKADSLKIRGGRNRLELSWLLLSDPKISSYKVYWNNKDDSIQGSITRTSDIDTVRLLLNQISEGSHDFDIYLFDKAGNGSIKSSITGAVYGYNYEKSLLNHTFISSRRDNENYIIEWMPEPEDGMVMIEIEYLNSFKEVIKKQIQGEFDVDTLLNFPINGSILLRTKFLPEPMALDTFNTYYQHYSFDN